MHSPSRLRYSQTSHHRFALPMHRPPNTAAQFWVSKRFFLLFVVYWIPLLSACQQSRGSVGGSTVLLRYHCSAVPLPLPAMVPKSNPVSTQPCPSATDIDFEWLTNEARTVLSMHCCCYHEQSEVAVSLAIYWKVRDSRECTFLIVQWYNISIVVTDLNVCHQHSTPWLN